MLSRRALLTGLACAIGAAPAWGDVMAFEVGQVWTLKPPMSENARVRIGRIEDDGATIHISLWGVPISDPQVSDVLNTPLVAGHLPITAVALRASIDQLTADTPPDNLGFDEGYATWRQDNGGIFTLTVSEIVDVMLQTIRSGRASVK